MLLRALLLLSLLVTGLGAASRPQPHLVSLQSADAAVLRTASKALGSHPRVQVLRWLRSRPNVASAVLGVDHKTVEIHYRDGSTSTIVPRMPGLVTVQGHSVLPQMHPMALPRQQFGGARAIVLEPFADCQGPCNSGGPDAADPEAGVLQNAGFQVDRAVDSQVNVALMTTLTQYNVVFMFTHSGIDSGGVAIIVTGQPWIANDQTMSGYVNDGTVTSTGIDGSNNLYWAIRTPFVLEHMGTFPAHSLLYLSGCAIYGTDFWSAGLAKKGAGALVTWDLEASLIDGYLTANAFFQFMGQGQSDGQALASTTAEGLGTSSPPQQATATLRLVGDPTITLAEAAGPGARAPTPTSTPVSFPAFPTLTGIPPPPPIPGNATNTPITSPAAPTATATSTPPASTSTPTPMPVTPTPTSRPPVPGPNLTLVPQVNPGETQEVSVSRFAPNTNLQLLVKFPNGDLVGQQETSDATGAAQFAFAQSSSKITRTNDVAGVTVSGANADGPVSVSAQYVIGFGKVDVAVDPRTQSPGRQVIVFVHTHQLTLVSITVRTSKTKLTTVKGETGFGGWTRLTYKVPKSVKSGRLLVVRAWARLGGHMIQAKTTLKVK